MSREETRAALAAVLARIELRRWPWKIEMHPTVGGTEVLFITEVVPDRDTGKTTCLGGMSYGEPPNLDSSALIEWVRAQLQRHVLHELDEALHVDNVRVFDPHEGESEAILPFDDDGKWKVR